jgi:hypothetical protein
MPLFVLSEVKNVVLSHFGVFLWTRLSVGIPRAILQVQSRPIDAPAAVRLTRVTSRENLLQRLTDEVKTVWSKQSSLEHGARRRTRRHDVTRVVAGGSSAAAQPWRTSSALYYTHRKTTHTTSIPLLDMLQALARTMLRCGGGIQIRRTAVMATEGSTAATEC